MRIFARALFLLGGISLLPGAASADYFMARDDKGQIYYTNAHPAAGRKAVIKRVRTRGIMRPISYNPRTFSDEFDSIIQGAAVRYDLDPKIIKAIIKVESDFQRYSISYKGARGLMQLMPATASSLKVNNAFDPIENIYGGAHYFRKMLDRFDNQRLALAAYNAGPTAVSRYNGVPPYKETQRYVQKVLVAYDALAGGAFSAAPLAKTGSGKENKKAPEEVVYYTYKDSQGQIYITDKPVGLLTVID